MVLEGRTGRGQLGRGRAVDFRVAPFSLSGDRVPACRDRAMSHMVCGTRGDCHLQ